MPEAILLAAGTGSRFGRQKLLHVFDFNGERQSLLWHSVRLWLSIFDRLTLAVNAEDMAVLSSIGHLPKAHQLRIKVVPVLAAQQGMGASLATTIAASDNNVGWIIGLADMPAIPTPVLVSLRDKLLEGHQLVAPYYQSTRGQPVGFAAQYRDELLHLEGDKGAREIVLRDAFSIYRVSTEHSGVLWDIDTTEDLLEF